MASGLISLFQSLVQRCSRRTQRQDAFELPSHPRELRRQPAVDVEDGTLHVSNPLLDEEIPEYKDSARRNSTTSREADEALPKRWLARTSPKGAFSPQLSGESILHIDHDAQSSTHSHQISPSLSSPSPEGWMESSKIVAEVHRISAIPDPLFLQSHIRKEDSVISVEEVELQEMWAEPQLFRMESAHELERSVSENYTKGWSMVRELQRSAASLDSWKMARSRSFESGELCEILEHRQRENAHWLRRYASDDEAEPPGKVRYNDTGSLEAVSDACLDLSVEHLYCQAPRQYKELWELRTTLELESSHEDFSQTVYSAPVLHATTSEDVDSQVDSGDEEAEDEEEEEEMEKDVESGAECGAQIKVSGYRNLPRDNSFESDGSSTDASRLEQQASASFDSTTGKGNHKLQQMKADSGYKSMESSVRAPKLTVVDDASISFDDEGISMPVKRYSRTWSKRRREYGKEACVDYPDDPPPSLFTRFFRAPPRRYFTRDFSVDKKSDQLFREFSRCDPTFEPRSRCRYRRRYHHRHFDADSLSPRRKLSPQDSIEEEDCCTKSVMSLPEDAQSNQSDAQTTISDVPIINVPLHAK